MNKTSTQPPAYTAYQVVDARASAVHMRLLPFLRQWRWYVFSLALALAGAYAYLLYKQPIYRIQASLMLQDEKRGMAQLNPLKELQALAPGKVVENELEVLRSSSLMERVVDKLHLDVRYYRPTRFGKREIYDDAPVWLLVENARPNLYEDPLRLTFPTGQSVQINGRLYPLNQRLQTPYGTLRVMTRRAVSPDAGPLLAQAMPRQAAVGQYLDRLKIEPTSKTSTVVQLKLEDAVPAKGEAILNTLIAEYNSAAVADKNRVTANTLRFVESRLRNVADELAGVEQSVEEYKSSRGITDLGAQSETFLQTVQQNDAQLNQVNIQLAALDDLETFVSVQADKRGSTPATVGLSDPVLLGQIDKLAQLELKRDEMEQVTTQENPLLVSVNKQIRATKENIRQNVATMKTMLTRSQQRYEAQNRKIEDATRALPQQERGLMDITRQQTIKNNLYTYLLQKREELAVAFAAAVADSRTVDAAQSSLGPVKPVGVVIYALFGLVGLLVPTGVIAGRRATNTRVMRRDDVERVTQTPILGEVMHKRPRHALVVGPNNRSVIAEQIRTIRTNLRLGQDGATGSQVLLFTSGMSGEGKSFLSLNLGASLSLLRQPTVIVEMDMRLPRLHQSLNMDNTSGLSDYLNGAADLDEILKPVPGYPNYYVITSGPLPADPSELLSTPAMGQLMRALRERFRYVILDAPPVGVVTDAQVVAPYADDTLFVVRHGVTPRQSLRQIERLFREQRFPNLNIVLNAVDGGDAYEANYRHRNSYSYR